MANTILYPSGFTRTIDENGSIDNSFKPFRNILKSKEEALISEVYKSYVGNAENNPGWEYRRFAITNIVKTVGNFWEWAELQLMHNDYIYDTSKEFLLDTIEYIVTGTRTMNIMNWGEILPDFPDARPRSATRERVNLMREIVKRCQKLDSTNWLTMWCRHPDGFEDMVHSFNYFFGLPKHQS